jgi:hypothetical protein
MLHTIFELFPFLAGLLFGLLGIRRFYRSIPPLALLTRGSIAIGSICSFLAGELFQGWIPALAAAGLDCGRAALGCVTAYFVLKCMAARWETGLSSKLLAGE